MNYVIGQKTLLSMTLPESKKSVERFLQQESEKSDSCFLVLIMPEQSLKYRRLHKKRYHLTMMPEIIDSQRIEIGKAGK